MANEPSPSTQDIRSSMQRRPGRPGKIEKARNPRRAMLRLALYMSPQAPALSLVIACILVYSILGLAGPYLMGVAIDRYIGGKDTAGLLRTAALMLAVYAASNLFQVVANWIMARVSQRSLKKLRSDLFGHLQKLSMRFFDTNAAGGLMSRLTNDIDAINQAVSQNVTTLIASVLTMAGIVAAMFALNHWLALASLFVMPLMFAFTRFVASFTRTSFRELQQKLGELNGIAEEAISGQKVIMAFRRNESAIEAFREKNRAVFTASVHANSYAMLLMPLTGVLGNFFVIVLASLGGWLALEDLVSVGVIATFISYGQNFISPLRQLANLYNSVQAALAGAERVFEIIDTPPEIDDAKPTGTGSRPGSRPGARIRGDVSMRDVCFGYVEGVPIIRNFNLDVAAGQSIALVGPTGAGKTTIINLLSRFYEIDSGSISIDGVDIRDMRKADLRRALGLVLQDTFMFAGSVLENIRYGRLDATDDECAEAAGMAEADHFIRQLPDGYRTMLSERAGNLSLGQRQLLSIARAILADPAILILDEATSSVDTRTELRIQKALLRLMKGRTSFVIAHRLSTIRDANRVVVIDHGGIVEQGSHRQLLDMHGFYDRLYTSQFKGNEI
ncbi:MAG: multidrug ABC transporter ATP-binding protein [Spirochaetae bacterium HGW-Spirochaetae-7]|jgi:ATP-binding cassette subfamily B protein|nr:MAG: multidrug ABC transporter ATP-binding protein [Spirochaetae bacterium HGW-Spirochaetae-7]